MADPRVIVNNVSEAQAHLQKLLTGNKAIKSFESWNDSKLSLRPVLEGQQVEVAVRQPNGLFRNYQLWIYQGKLALLTPEQVNGIHKREVVDGIVTPLARQINPLTGQPMIRGEQSAEKWVSADGKIANANPQQVLVAFDQSKGTAKVVSQEDWNNTRAPLRPQRWWFDKDNKPSVGAEVGTKDRMGVGSTITLRDPEQNNKAVTYSLKPVPVENEDVVKLRAQVDKLTEVVHAPLSQGPAIQLVIGQEVLNQIPASLLNAKPQVPVAQQAPVPQAAKPVAQPKAEVSAPVTAAAKPTSGTLATTAIEARTIVDLIAPDYTDKLGNVAGKELARGHSGFYRSMNQLQTAMTDYHAGKDGAEARVIGLVNGIPDGYKQLALDYVRESVLRKNGLVPDFYKNLGTTLYSSNDPKNLANVKEQLREREESFKKLELNAPGEKPVIVTPPPVAQPRAQNGFDPALAVQITGDTAHCDQYNPSIEAKFNAAAQREGGPHGRPMVEDFKVAAALPVEPQPVVDVVAKVDFSGSTIGRGVGLGKPV